MTRLLQHTGSTQDTIHARIGVVTAMTPRLLWARSNHTRPRPFVGVFVCAPPTSENLNTKYMATHASHLHLDREKILQLGATSVRSFGNKLPVLVEDIKRSKKKAAKALEDGSVEAVVGSLKDLLAASQNIQKEADILAKNITKYIKPAIEESKIHQVLEFIAEEEAKTPAVTDGEDNIDLSFLLQQLNDVKQLLKAIDKHLLDLLNLKDTFNFHRRSSKRDILVPLNYMATFQSQKLLNYSSSFMEIANDYVMTGENPSFHKPVQDASSLAVKSVRQGAASAININPTKSEHFELP